ncbi:hypothetical protein evm_000053 [Chilo suppressalis]|nr:hypothetical protein evm_000053 [Chilo suppressalis]
MPYSDRYAEKQAKLLRLKVNRKHVLERCEKLLSTKIKKDKLVTEAKQSRDKLDLLRLAIEQRKSNIEEKKKELTDLKQHNHDLSLKLPRYQKRVSLLGKHAQDQRIELQSKINTYSEQADVLAALRRCRIRQLTKYIFPVYISYDTSDSLEDMEFVGDTDEEEPPKRPQLHIVNSWISTDGDFSHLQAWNQNKEAGSLACGANNPAHRTQAALGLAAQLAALLAWTLDARLPHAITLSEYCNWRLSRSGVSGRVRRLQSACAALSRRAGAPPPARPLAALALAARAALADDPALGRVEGWVNESAWGVCAGPGVAGEGGETGEGSGWEEWEPDHDDAEPEHLNWPDQLDEIEELGVTPPGAPPASLVTSAAASLASLWRGWAK